MEKEYQELKNGDILQEGDEVFNNSSKKWEKSINTPGQPISSSLKYRRPIEKVMKPDNEYRELSGDETIGKGDEYWNRIDCEWKVCSQAVGRKVNSYTNARFRRYVGPQPSQLSPEIMFGEGYRLVASHELLIEGDELLCDDGTWTQTVKPGRTPTKGYSYRRKLETPQPQQYPSPPSIQSQPTPYTTPSNMTSSMDEMIKRLAIEAVKPDIELLFNADRIVTAEIQKLQESALNENEVLELVEQKLKTVDISERKIVIEHRVLPESPIQELQEHTHPKLLEAINVLQAGIPVALVGPTGSGKTMAARQISKILASKHYCAKQMCRSVQLHDFVGYTSSSGSYIPGYLVPVILEGGLGFIDECDAGNENVLMVLKGIFSKSINIPFHGQITPHDETRILCAMNTWGNGATREYVGRNPLDAAFLNEFYTIDWDYDIKFEEQLVRSVVTLEQWNAKGCEVFNGLLELRTNISQNNFKIIVSTRNILNVTKLLFRPNADLNKILKGVIFRNTSQTDIDRVLPQGLKPKSYGKSTFQEVGVDFDAATGKSFQGSKKISKDTPF